METNIGEGGKIVFPFRQKKKIVPPPQKNNTYNRQTLTMIRIKNYDIISIEERIEQTKIVIKEGFTSIFTGEPSNQIIFFYTRAS